MTNFYTQSEISLLGECLARCYFADQGGEKVPIEPEIVATKFFGLNIFPQHQLTSAGVRSGIDTSQSVIFIDHDTYMSDELQPYARQGIAHELGHVIFDGSLIRQLAGTTAEDAFELHELIVGNQPGIESRANMLAGALLVPRWQMLQRVATMLNKNHERVTESFPGMTLGMAFSQMSASYLSRHFGVSDNVIVWRFNQENFHEDFSATPDTLLTDINLKLVAKLAGATFKPKPLNERLKALLPAEVLLTYQRQLANA